MQTKQTLSTNNKLIILYTSDIHGYLFKTNYITEVDQGLLAYYNYLKEVKKKYKHVLLIDNGDLIQGSPLTYYLQKNFTNYNPIIGLLNELDFDILNFGNHEFNYGLTYLINSYQQFNGAILNANIQGMAKYLPVKPYQIYTFNTFKVAVISLTTKQIPKWEKPENIKGLQFRSIIETYQNYEQELQSQADFIIVLYHGGFETSLTNLEEYLETPTGENEAGQLLKQFTSIDLLLTGHQHRNINQIINNVWCRQTLNNGQNIAQIEIDITTQKVINSLEITAKEQIVAPSFNYNKILQTLDYKILEFEQATQKYLDTVIGTLDKEILVTDLFKTRLNSHPLINLINKIQLSVTKADISAMSLFDSAVGFKQEITIRDLIANYPYPNTLVVLEITKEQLLQALEVSASYFILKNDKIEVNPKFSLPKPQHFHYDMFDGLHYEINLTKAIGQRVTIKNFINTIDEQKIKLVVNNFRASNYDWYPMYGHAKILEETSFDMVELLINYINEHQNLISDDIPRYTIKKN